jgi:hypothetical protein
MRTIAMVVMGDLPITRSSNRTRIPETQPRRASRKARDGQTLIPHSVVPLLHFGYFSITGVSGASAGGPAWGPVAAM